MADIISIAEARAKRDKRLLTKMELEGNDVEDMVLKAREMADAEKLSKRIREISLRHRQAPQTNSGRALARRHDSAALSDAPQVQSPSDLGFDPWDFTPAS